MGIYFLYIISLGQNRSKTFCVVFFFSVCVFFFRIFITAFDVYHTNAYTLNVGQNESVWCVFVAFFLRVNIIFGKYRKFNSGHVIKAWYDVEL